MKTRQTAQRWDDIVFENRNKNYGAYAIRQSYPVNVVRALFLCFGAIASIFFLSNQYSAKDIGNSIVKEIKTIGSAHPPKVKLDIMVTREVTPIKKLNSKLFPTKITVAEVPDVEPENIVMEDFTSIDNPDGAFVESGNDATSPGDVVEPIKAPPFLIVAEVMPFYEGGIPEMIKFIQKKLHYPAYASRMGIAGTVYVSFIVSTSGAITHVEIVKGIDKSCDEEAMRVIGLMNKWNPGMQNKMPVAVRMVLPIKFVAGK